MAEQQNLPRKIGKVCVSERMGGSGLLRVANRRNKSTHSTRYRMAGPCQSLRCSCVMYACFDVMKLVNRIL